MGLSKGRIQVYTGEGKGKTSAALGLAFRAVGHGFRVIMIQFLKGETRTGELVSAQRLAPELEIKPMGREGLIGPEGPTAEDIALAAAALEEAQKILDDRLCDVLVLDEINVAVSMGVITEEAVLGLLDKKSEDVEVVLTGRGAPLSFLERADLVTTMACTKHYYDQGQRARVGIEY